MDSNDISAYSSVIREWQGGSFRGRSGRRKKKRQKPWSERIADWTRAFIAFLFSNVGIVCLVVSYTIAGAFLFQFIEGKHSLKKASHVLNLRNETAFRLWELTSQVIFQIQYFNFRYILLKKLVKVGSVPLESYKTDFRSILGC